MSHLPSSIPSSPPPPGLFKKRKLKPSARTKSVNDHHLSLNNAASDPSAPLERPSSQVVRFTKRKSFSSGSLLYHATAGRPKRPISPSDQESASSSESDDDLDSHIAQRGGVSYQAQGSARQQAQLVAQDRLDQQERRTPSSSSHSIVPRGGNAQDDDGLYRGQASTKHQLPRGSAKYGPVKAGPDNIRTITLLDYQPDVCKDYKETGYCGFGDTCKFLHDRSDYMHGWQLDEAFNSSRRPKDQVASEDEEEVPFACLLCRQPFTDPIVTKCQHYFCSSCAIKRFAKTPKCFACGAATSGIFNKATKILERMRLKQERLQKEKQEAKEAQDGGFLEGLETLPDDQEGSERSFYEDE